MSKYDANTIHKEMLDNIPDSYAKTIGYPLYDLTAAFAIEAEKLFDVAADVEAKLDIENLTGEELTRRVYQLTGMKRRDAVFSVGEVTVTGKGTVPAGSIFTTADGIQYETTREAVIIDSGNIPIRAVVAGAEGNVGAGSIIKIPVTIPGITAVTNEASTGNGYRQESDTELKERFYDELQNPVVSGNKTHYEKWAKEISGVGQAKCFSLAFGENTVEVCIIGNDGLPASEELIAAVQTYIDPDGTGRGEGQAPAGAYCTVTTAERKDIDISAKLVLAQGISLDAVQTTIEKAVKEELKNNAFVVSSVSYAKIANIIFTTKGVLDYQNLTVNGGTANISITDHEVAVLRGVHFIE